MGRGVTTFVTLGIRMYFLMLPLYGKYIYDILLYQSCSLFLNIWYTPKITIKYIIVVQFSLFLCIALCTTDEVYLSIRKLINPLVSLALCFTNHLEKYSIVKIAHILLFLLHQIPM